MKVKEFDREIAIDAFILYEQANYMKKGRCRPAKVDIISGLDALMAS